MVFNWFRRQFSTSETPEDKQEQEAPEQQEQETAPEQSTEEHSPAAAEDYLSWAKTAYKNIQKQQQQTEEPAETAQEDESAIQSASSATPEIAEAPVVPEPVQAADSSIAPEEVEESAASTETEQLTETAATTVEPEEPTTPETLAVEETPSPTTDVSEPQVEAATTEEGVASVEPTVEPTEVEVTAEAGEPATPPLVKPTASEPETLPEAPPPTSEEPQEAGSKASTADIAELEPDPQTPVLETPAAIEAEEAPAAPIPLWARASADRQARLERLKETAIELPEPEPVRTPVQAVEPAATTTVEVEEIPGLAFDEGFLWSAEVLAAQGRRPEDVSIEEISWLKRLRQGLDKTRRSLINQLKAIVGQGPLNQDAVMEIEALLLQADVGVEATDYIISTLQEKLRQDVLPPDQAIAYLKDIIRDLLDRPCKTSYTSTFAPDKDTLNIWLMTGVNGVGKTTTIGKIAHLAQKSDYRCLIAAADTFRAAAVEQVKIWGERSGTEVIANPGKNTDPAAVVFDAIAAAQSRNTELLLVDTAGRLQNKKNLMDELAKIRRIVDKKAPDAKVESLLVLDATLGQNGLRQAEVFSEAAKLSGVVLTKLDGTAKGGVALAVVQQLGLPIRFIGAGEGIEDLRPFSSYEFVEALLSG
ncbi:MAG: signal recognition particle-docking protein FtsY [Coleofasciculus sp. S288]|nr:signal recognition particle-docking protein FtsY [Coleofasciculus sp. S288]